MRLTVLQVGTGTGYYTAILARLVGRDGRVHAFEIDGGLAERTKTNLKHLPQVDVQARSGIADDLPKVDAVYVCAGITQPSWSWLDALKPNGRLVFPLHAVGGVGGMLMIRWPGQGAVWPARFISPAAFISCTGPQDDEGGRRLHAAFTTGEAKNVRSFRTNHPPTEPVGSPATGGGFRPSTRRPILKSNRTDRSIHPERGEIEVEDRLLLHPLVTLLFA